ncbi:hypothetical protein OTU49_017243 [Cherax quadricarinatus]|uniref:C2H2-type domain-containing protein n=1 Tax=Cherax quadricarinatus TaxID=27406 RepID=A0AAW0Y7A6_CHEQU
MVNADLPLPITLPESSNIPSLLTTSVKSENSQESSSRKIIIDQNAEEEHFTCFSLLAQKEYLERKEQMLFKQKNFIKLQRSNILNTFSGDNAKYSELLEENALMRTQIEQKISKIRHKIIKLNKMLTLEDSEFRYEIKNSKKYKEFASRKRKISEGRECESDDGQIVLNEPHGFSTSHESNDKLRQTQLQPSVMTNIEAVTNRLEPLQNNHSTVSISPGSSSSSINRKRKLEDNKNSKNTDCSVVNEKINFKKRRTKKVRKDLVSTNHEAILNEEFLQNAAQVNWCRLCNGIFYSVANYVDHLASSEHLQRRKLNDGSWLRKLPQVEQKYVKQEDLLDLYGVEFLDSVTLFFCNLCKVLIWDRDEALFHPRCPQHAENFKNYVSENVLRELNFLQRKATAYKRHISRDSSFTGTNMTKLEEAYETPVETLSPTEDTDFNVNCSSGSSSPETHPRNIVKVQESETDILPPVSNMASNSSNEVGTSSVPGNKNQIEMPYETGAEMCSLPRQKNVSVAYSTASPLLSVPELREIVKIDEETSSTNIVGLDKFRLVHPSKTMNTSYCPVDCGVVDEEWDASSIPVALTAVTKLIKDEVCQDEGNTDSFQVRNVSDNIEVVSERKANIRTSKDVNSAERNDLLCSSQNLVVLTNEPNSQATAFDRIEALRNINCKTEAAFTETEELEKFDDIEDSLPDLQGVNEVDEATISEFKENEVQRISSFVHSLSNTNRPPLQCNDINVDSDAEGSRNLITSVEHNQEIGGNNLSSKSPGNSFTSSSVNVRSDKQDCGNLRIIRVLGLPYRKPRKLISFEDDLQNVCENVKTEKQSPEKMNTNNYLQSGDIGVHQDDIVLKSLKSVKKTCLNLNDTFSSKMTSKKVKKKAHGSKEKEFRPGMISSSTTSRNITIDNLAISNESSVKAYSSCTTNANSSYEDEGSNSSASCSNILLPHTAVGSSETPVTDVLWNTHTIKCTGLSLVDNELKASLTTKQVLAIQSDIYQCANNVSNLVEKVTTAEIEGKELLSNANKEDKIKQTHLMCVTNPEYKVKRQSRDIKYSCKPMLTKTVNAPPVNLVTSHNLISNDLTHDVQNADLSTESVNLVEINDSSQQTRAVEFRRRVDPRLRHNFTAYSVKRPKISVSEYWKRKSDFLIALKTFLNGSKVALREYSKQKSGSNLQIESKTSQGSPGTSQDTSDNKNDSCIKASGSCEPQSTSQDTLNNKNVSCITASVSHELLSTSPSNNKNDSCIKASGSCEPQSTSQDTSDNKNDSCIKASGSCEPQSTSQDTSDNKNDSYIKASGSCEPQSTSQDTSDNKNDSCIKASGSCEPQSTSQDTLNNKNVSCITACGSCELLSTCQDTPSKDKNDSCIKDNGSCKVLTENISTSSVIGEEFTNNLNIDCCIYKNMFMKLPFTSTQSTSLNALPEEKLEQCTSMLLPKKKCTRLDVSPWRPLPEQVPQEAVAVQSTQAVNQVKRTQAVNQVKRTQAVNHIYKPASKPKPVVNDELKAKALNAKPSTVSPKSWKYKKWVNKIWFYANHLFLGDSRLANVIFKTNPKCKKNIVCVQHLQLPEAMAIIIKEMAVVKYKSLFLMVGHHDLTAQCQDVQCLACGCMTPFEYVRVMQYKLEPFLKMVMQVNAQLKVLFPELFIIWSSMYPIDLLQYSERLAAIHSPDSHKCNRDSSSYLSSNTENINANSNRYSDLNTEYINFMNLHNIPFVDIGNVLKSRRAQKLNEFPSCLFDGLHVRTAFSGIVADKLKSAICGNLIKNSESVDSLWK